MKQFLMVALVAALLLFGCAGSAPQQPATGGNNNVPPAPPAGQNNNMPPAPPAGNGTQASGQQPSASAFDALLSALKSASGWKVSYTITMTGSQPTYMTQYVKGTEKIRMDISAEGTETRTYMLGKDSYTCMNSGGWTCFKFSNAVSGNDAIGLEQGMESDSAKYTVTADGTMLVANVPVTCYKVTSTDGTSRYCVSAEGVPLYIQTTSSQNGVAYVTEMTATAYTPSASDSDFTLPAAAQEMPGIPSG
ncbi:Uncharacterised protein [uncultured archaeon]|nr:Uncharacterised protein [uncultured archaeon]